MVRHASFNGWGWGNERGAKSGGTPRRSSHRGILFGSSADPEGPIALRPRIAPGLPVRRIRRIFVSWSMAPANRPSQRPLIRIPGPIRRSCWAGIDYDHQPPPCALCVMRRGAIDRHFTGISVSFLRYGGRISGPLPCKEIVLIDGFGAVAGRMPSTSPGPWA